MSGSLFTSGSGTDFNLEGTALALPTLSASVDAQQSLNGAISHTGGSISFETSYEPASGTTAGLDQVEGTYTGRVVISVGAETADVVVSSTGSLSGSGSSGCSVTGSVTPRTDVNAYDFSLTFGPDTCFYADQTFEGIATLGSDGRWLQAVATNDTLSEGIAFFGSRP